MGVLFFILYFFLSLSVSFFLPFFFSFFPFFSILSSFSWDVSNSSLTFLLFPQVFIFSPLINNINLEHSFFSSYLSESSDPFIIIFSLGFSSRRPSLTFFINQKRN